MTVNDLRCDRCGISVPVPAESGGRTGAVRFLYHPGNFLLKDDSGLLCVACWDSVTTRLGERLHNRCCICGVEIEHARSLHWHRAGDPQPWQLCARCAVGLLNELRTVEPKLDPKTFTLSGDWSAR